MHVFAKYSVCFMLAVCFSFVSRVDAAELPEFREIVKQSSPAVVKIIVEQKPGNAGGQGGQQQSRHRRKG